jgi:hypothetical protein
MEQNYEIVIEFLDQHPQFISQVPNKAAGAGQIPSCLFLRLHVGRILLYGIQTFLGAKVLLD